MKVTFCAYDFPGAIGGPHTWLRRLLPALREKGIDIQLLFVVGGDRQACRTLQTLQQQGFKSATCQWHSYTEWHIRWMLKQLAASPPDIFVPNLVVPAYYASRWVKAAGIHTVGILHSDDPFYHTLVEEFVLGKIENQLTGLVCVSEFLANWTLDRAPQTVAIRRLPYGVPIPTRKARYPLDSEPLKIAYVGSLKETQKQISALVEGLRQVTTEIENTEAVLYGDGKAKERVEEILARSEIAPPIRLAGAIDNQYIQSCLLECHVIILLSDYEGLPIALMEGMACGLVPIVLPIRSGIPELVEHEVTGLIVSDRGPSLVQAVRRLRENPGLWRSLSQAARARIQANYESSNCCARWVDFLQDLNRSSSPTTPIKVHQRLRLPPVRDALAREDNRYFLRRHLKSVLLSTAKKAKEKWLPGWGKQRPS